MAVGEKAKRMRVGWWVFIGLGIFTAVEYALSLAVQGALPFLTVTAIVKAGLIVYYFMHVSQIWRQEAETE